jgi:replication factor C subunit 3/5
MQSKDGEIPHLLFYGPSGAGKKTRILALLKEIYGAGAERVRLEHRTFKTASNRAIEVGLACICKVALSKLTQ